MVGGTVKLGKNQDIAESSAFFIKEEEKCLTVPTSSGKNVKNREAAVLQQKWELKPIVHKQGYKCRLQMQLHAEHTENKPAIPSPLCQTGSGKPHLQPQKQRVTSVTCTNYFRRPHCRDYFSDAD